MMEYAWQDHCVLKRCSIPMKPKHYTNIFVVDTLAASVGYICSKCYIQLQQVLDTLATCVRYT